MQDTLASIQGSLMTSVRLIQGQEIKLEVYLDLRYAIYVINMKLAKRLDQRQKKFKKLFIFIKKIIDFYFKNYLFIIYFLKSGKKQTQIFSGNKSDSYFSVI